MIVTNTVFPIKMTKLGYGSRNPHVRSIDRSQLSKSHYSLHCYAKWPLSRLADCFMGDNYFTQRPQLWPLSEIYVMAIFPALLARDIFCSLFDAGVFCGWPKYMSLRFGRPQRPQKIHGGGIITIFHASLKADFFAPP